jgi:hypothetical protein
MTTPHETAGTHAALETQLTEENGAALETWVGRFAFSDPVVAGNALRDFEAAGAAVRPGRSNVHYIVEFAPGAVSAVARVAAAAGAIAES